MTTKRFAPILCGVLLTMGITNAQQTTERYIPIGESPGVSDSIIGTITAVDYDEHSLTVGTDDAAMTVRMDESTRYFLDRSKKRASNQSASIEDCRVGLRVEIKYDEDLTADWVKIEAN